MASLVRVIITSSEEGRGAFGVRCDTDENVYFPMGVAEAMGLEEFEEVEAVIVKNDRETPQFKAIKARRLEEA